MKYIPTILSAILAASQVAASPTADGFKFSHKGGVFATDAAGSKIPKGTYAPKGMTGAVKPDAKTKVFYLTRHVDAYNNNAKDKYNKIGCWACSASGKDKVSEFTWKDADLTPAAKPQIDLAVGFWSSADGKALPQANKFWSSPSQRAVKTGDQIFSTIAGFDTLIVSDLIRELVDDCSCNHRSDQTAIKGFGSKITFDAGFSAADNLWVAGKIESADTMKVRVYKWLSQRFDESATGYHVASHGGTIKALLELVGHPNSGISLEPGQMIPVVITAGAGGAAPAPGASTTPPKCAGTCPA